MTQARCRAAPVLAKREAAANSTTCARLGTPRQSPESRNVITIAARALPYAMRSFFVERPAIRAGRHNQDRLQLRGSEKWLHAARETLPVN
jgi:hypothetical protein